MMRFHALEFSDPGASVTVLGINSSLGADRTRYGNVPWRIPLVLAHSSVLLADTN